MYEVYQEILSIRDWNLLYANMIPLFQVLFNLHFSFSITIHFLIIPLFFSCSYVQRNKKKQNVGYYNKIDYNLFLNRG